MGFTGHHHDDGIGLIYMNARYFVPELGRFATPDSIIPNPANPQSLNRYTYVLNNPLGFTDPSGHDGCSSNTGSGYSIFGCAAEKLGLSAGEGSPFTGAGEALVTKSYAAMEDISEYLLTVYTTVAVFVPYADTGDDILAFTSGCGYACQVGVEQPANWFWRGFAGAGIVLPFGYRHMRMASDMAGGGTRRLAGILERENAITTITDRFRAADARCLNCVDELYKAFPNEGQSILLITQGEGPPLIGQFGQGIGAPQGWHAVWVDNSSLNVYDNAGNQGPLGSYITNMRIQNKNNFQILPMSPEAIQSLLIP